MKPFSKTLFICILLMMKFASFKRSILFLVSISFLVMAASYFLISDTKKNKIQDGDVNPKTANSVVGADNGRFKRLSDLAEIVYALEKYKTKYRHYPISSGEGDGWDGLYSDYGASKQDWIEGLTPEFLRVLPRDPRQEEAGSNQYLYRSNGAHYKLIAHSPEDCEEVRETFPQLMDPVRNCWAYGYWTKKAEEW